VQLVDAVYDDAYVAVPPDEQPVVAYRLSPKERRQRLITSFDL